MLDIPQLDQYKDDSGVQMDSMDSIEEDLPVADHYSENVAGPGPSKYDVNTKSSHFQHF